MSLYYTTHQKPVFCFTHLLIRFTTVYCSKIRRQHCATVNKLIYGRFSMKLSDVIWKLDVFITCR